MGQHQTPPNTTASSQSNQHSIWHNRLMQKLGPIDGHLKADWHKLFLAYEEGWIDTKNKDWKEIICPEDVSSWLDYLPEDRPRCFADDQSFLVGHVPEFRNPERKLLLHQILIRLDGSDGYCVLWNEPLNIMRRVFWRTIDPPHEATLYEEGLSDEFLLQRWKRELGQKILATEVCLSLGVEADGEELEDGEIRISGTAEDILKAISHFYETHSPGGHHHFEGIFKHSPHSYFLQTGS